MRRLLFGRSSHSYHVPADFTALLTWKHADIALFPSNLLVKSFAEIGGAEQGNEPAWKVHGQVAQRFVKIGQKVRHRLRGSSTANRGPRTTAQ